MQLLDNKYDEPLQEVQANEEELVPVIKNKKI